MSKSVRVLGLEPFSTLTAAKKHYKAIREATSIGELVPLPEKERILDIYRRYSEARPCDEACKSPVDVTTKLDNKMRPGSRYATTKAFAVLDASGTAKNFSMDKALEAIAE